jgi:hypothetical protein
MGKVIITYNQINEINHLLEDKNLNIKIHLHDLCGSQSFTIEAIENVNEEQQEAMRQVVTDYFNKINLSVRFFDNNQSFAIV